VSVRRRVRYAYSELGIRAPCSTNCAVWRPLSADRSFRRRRRRRNGRDATCTVAKSCSANSATPSKSPASSKTRYPTSSATIRYATPYTLYTERTRVFGKSDEYDAPIPRKICVPIALFRYNFLRTGYFVKRVYYSCTTFYNLKRCGDANRNRGIEKKMVVSEHFKIGRTYLKIRSVY